MNALTFSSRFSTQKSASFTVSHMSVLFFLWYMWKFSMLKLKAPTRAQYVIDMWW